MVYKFTPSGVCSRQIEVELEGSKIKSANFVGGCSGNTQGISALVVGMDAEEAVKRLRGIDCRGRGTSCPDQLAIAIEEALEQE
jgi:uncharacterized protein (TIGR03905 family)